MGCVSALAFSGAACAQDETGPRLGTMTVTDTALEEPDVKVEKAESPKYTRPLLDTPQTITVLSNTTIRQQNLLTLREALTTIPGITFGAGEGGGGYGDSINLRGQSANSDIQIDGVRDSAQYSRSDTFNLQQIEVVNGANSVYAGSGSIGGSINLITKRPQAEDLSVVSAGIGTDNYYRGTIDSNLRLSDLIAVRLNAMVHENDVPGRDFDSYERWGVAPSITLGIDGPTKLTFLYVHQEDENTPVYGVPYYPQAGGLVPGARYGAYYGYKNVDRQEQTVDMATVIFEHAFSDKVSLRNLTRWQNVVADTYVNPPQGTFCLASTGLTPSGGACVADIDTRTGAGQVFNVTVPAGFYLPSGPRGTTRLTDTSILYNQFDLRAELNTGGIEHSITLGASFSQEDFDLSTGNVLREADGSNPFGFNPSAPSASGHLPFINIANPDQIITGPALAGARYGNNVYPGAINYVEASTQRGDTRNIAVYLFDAIKLSDQFEINGGVRWENNRAKFHNSTIDSGALQLSDDDLFSYRVGFLFKPVPNASIYAAYGNSETPASTIVRTGCAVSNLVANCTVAPEEAKNYEVGAKVDLFDAQIQLTASLFRNERTNFRVASNDPLAPTLQVLDGRSRVDGLTLGASGRITPEWTIFANYTYLDSEVLQSISNLDRRNNVADPQRGNALINTPKHSGSLFTTYQFPFGLQVGYGLTYQGSFLVTNSNATGVFKSDDWLTHRAYLAYSFDNGLSAQLNVQNFTNEKYFTGIRNNLAAWAVPGEARSAVLTLSYSF